MGAEESTLAAEAEQARNAPPTERSDGRPPESVRPVHLAKVKETTVGGGGKLGGIAEDEEVGGGASADKLEVQNMMPAGVIQVLATLNSEDDSRATTALNCFSRIRVLCREVSNQQAFDNLGAAFLLVKVLNDLTVGAPSSASLDVAEASMVVLQGLAALVNLVSDRECMSRRDSACMAGALKVAVNAMDGTLVDRNCGTEKQKLDDRTWDDITEMSASLILNLCYGNDENVLTRREQAASDGAVTALVKAIQRTKAYDTCVKALRVVVDRMQSSREEALKLGADEQWVRPVTKTRPQDLNSSGGSNGGGGQLSARASASALLSSARNMMKAPLSSWRAGKAANEIKAKHDVRQDL